MEFNPIFVVGAERSGTTVFRLMLNHHPEIAVCSEFEYIVDSLVGCEGWPNLSEFHDRLRSNWIFQEHKFSIDPALSYPELANSFLQQVLQRKQAKHVIGVVHRNFDQLKRIWPNARYIHIVRDPRDVAKSVIGMGWAGNVWDGVRFWLEAEHIWNQMKVDLPGDRFIEIKYEELICSPETVLTQVCQLVGTEYNPQMLEYHKSTTYSKPNAKLIQQWKHKLRPYEISLVESRVGALLSERGYQLSGQPIRHPSLPEKIWLHGQSRLGRLNYRLSHLGFWLFIGDFMSRKLNIRPWQEQLEPQITAIWRSTLK